MTGQDSARPRARARARLATLGTALVALLLVAGCGGSKESDGSATPTATTSVSATETETASPTTATPEPTGTAALPPLPDEATENTPEGAEAFIRYYFDVVNTATMAPDPTLIPQLSASECVACANLQGIADELSLAGQHAEAEAFAVRDIELLEEQSESTLLFTLTLEVSPVDVLNSDGTVAYTLEANTSGRVVGVRWEESAWRLLDAEVA